MDENTKKYIEHQLQAGKTREQVVGDLVANGWQTDQAKTAVGSFVGAQATNAPQPAGPQPVTESQPVAQTLQTAPSKQVRTGWKKWVLGDNSKKPPIAAQIIYAVNFVLLILGILTALSIWGVFNSSPSVVPVLAAFGLAGSISLWPYIILFFVVGQFFLVDRMRAGRFWALCSYSTVIFLGALDFLFGLTGPSFAGSRFGIEDILRVLISILLIKLIVKNRSYFN